ncbi:endonuclease/exonuclease/phosphatase family protein [Sediminispirochaeta smaragdinae]|uniref:Endonuclease/exonuclease/phosphatase n=1 Tax=Sediminispirochaeta smaragdinae (strain DSM 11293 / JCM 15392 / SEBR 4228) TaxID=573413 RepID=E1R182_SEDSS|nr:endonuclease/exonuclease/phosphatase family protein [Sediminispirochaeta smaragdinae]ADK80902.1 Endonuclease/exonuclease/phosphatase [Sediminispirochaeta smaragdinae DSM 11293]
MQTPFRFSLCTCNIWNTEKWEQRKVALEDFLVRFNPDICCFQEIREETMRFLDEAMPFHARVEDDFNGWRNEGNIYYRKDLFRETGHTELFLDMPEPDRRLFILDLECLADGRKFQVCTVHLTHQNNRDEQDTGTSYRHEEALKIARWLKNRKSDAPPLLLCGDFNDPWHPSRILAEAGLNDVFYELGLLQPPTFPNPALSEEIYMNETIDRIMYGGGPLPVLASVVDFHGSGASCGVSDHKPVVAVFEF